MMNNLNLRNKILIPVTMLVLIAFSLMTSLYISHFTKVLKKHSNLLIQQAAAFDTAFDKHPDREKLIKQLNLKINQSISDESRDFSYWAVGMGLFFILILMLLIFFISGLIVKPLYKLVSVSQALSNGHFHSRMHLDSNDEFGVAARYIDKAFDIVTDKMFWYERILDGIPFPISVTDLDMRWTFINRKAELIFKKKRSALMGKHCSSWDMDICNTDQCGIDLLKKGIIESSFTRSETGKHFKVDTAWLLSKKVKKQVI